MYLRHCVWSAAALYDCARTFLRTASLQVIDTDALRELQVQLLERLPLRSEAIHGAKSYARTETAYVTCSLDRYTGLVWRYVYNPDG